MTDLPFLHPFSGLDLTALLEARARQRGAHPLYRVNRGPGIGKHRI